MCQLHELVLQHTGLPWIMFFAGMAFFLSLPSEIQRYCNISFSVLTKSLYEANVIVLYLILNWTLFTTSYYIIHDPKIREVHSISIFNLFFFLINQELCVNIIICVFLTLSTMLSIANTYLIHILMDLFLHQYLLINQYAVRQKELWLNW